MKIAVYAIALNEARHVERWAKSAKDADEMVILDTGSTDKTEFIARENGVFTFKKLINPWRFDVARNYALDMLEPDIDMCIALDLDEVLMPGWRQALERAWESGIDRPAYDYTWSWNADGSPALSYHADKIHPRHGFRWKHPVHEVITPALGMQENRAYIAGLRIEHHADNSKSRDYLPLLELAVKEDPHDDRNAHYYARELMFRGQPDKALEEFERHLSLPRATWIPERAASFRYMSRCAEDKEMKIYYLQKATQEDADSRESWVELGSAYFNNAQYKECIKAMQRAWQIIVQQSHYLTESWAWGPLSYDLAARASWHLGDYTNAYTFNTMAFQLDPSSSHVLSNHKVYLEALQKSKDNQNG